jgi:hypothetical protein
LSGFYGSLEEPKFANIRIRGISDGRELTMRQMAPVANEEFLQERLLILLQ